MGNPRAHFYVYQGKDGTVHDPMPKNTYNLPCGEGRLSDYYFHDKDIPGVRRSGLVGVKLWVGDERVGVLSDNPSYYTLVHCRVCFHEVSKTQNMR